MALLGGQAPLLFSATVFELASTRELLAEHSEYRAERGEPRAAVAAVLRDGDRGLEVLVIERARRLGDRWSGHMAFPGGRHEPGDRDVRATAERETREELGVDLSGAEQLCRLNDLRGMRASGSRMAVSAFVYSLDGKPVELRPNEEVADAFWQPIAELVDPARYVDYRYPRMPFKTFPAIQIGDRRRVIWGLTFRFFEDFFERLGQPFPVTCNTTDS